jgi:hypothetical protein
VVDYDRASQRHIIVYDIFKPHESREAFAIRGASASECVVTGEHSLADASRRNPQVARLVGGGSGGAAPPRRHKRRRTSSDDGVSLADDDVW